MPTMFDVAPTLSTPPAPAKPTHGLLTVATIVPPENADWLGWQIPMHCPTGGTYDCNATGDKTTAPAPAVATFEPFLAYQVALCKSGTSRSVGSVAQARAAVRTWLDTNTSGWIATGLELGLGVSNPKLTTLPLATGSVVGDSLTVAIARLLGSRATAGAMDRPIIHIPAYASPFLEINMAVFADIADVVMDAGYGLTQAEPVGQAYITGPVEVSWRMASLVHENDDTLTEYRRNQTEAIEELMAVVRWDSCAAFRALFTGA